MKLRKEDLVLLPRIIEFCKEPRTYLDVSREFKISKALAREMLSKLIFERTVSFEIKDSRTTTFITKKR